MDGEVDPAALSRHLRDVEPTFAVVKRVGPMPRDGVREAFRFGASYAVARTVVSLAGIPLHLVTPQTWKKAYRLSGGPEGKEAARAMALRQFPASAASFARKKDHNRAEAALLAHFAALNLTP